MTVARGKQLIFFTKFAAIESKMYWFETVGAAVARFQLDKRAGAGIFLFTTRHSAVAWRTVRPNERGPLFFFFLLKPQRLYSSCGDHFAAAGAYPMMEKSEEELAIHPSPSKPVLGPWDFDAERGRSRISFMRWNFRQEGGR